jgi:hypothetical protein
VSAFFANRRLAIFNSTGQKAHEQSPGPGSNNVKTSSAPVGAYHYVIHQNYQLFERGTLLNE